MAYRLARPALRGISSRPRGSKQATDRQSGGVLNIEEKLIAVGTHPSPRSAAILNATPSPKKKEKTIPSLPAVFASAKRGEKREGET